MAVFLTGSSHRSLTVGQPAMDTNKDTEQEAPELIALHPQTLRLKNGYIYLIEDAEHGDVIYRRVDPPAAPTLHCSCGAACTPEEYARHRERGHDTAIGDQEKLKQIRERRARVENSDLDYATADTGTRCVGYIYEKGTGSKVAQMESLYDVMRGQFFANAAADIDFLLSLVDSKAAGGETGYWPTLCDRGDGVKGHFCIGRLIRPNEPYWEFWNKGRWVSAGEVFIGREAAQKQLDAIRTGVSVAATAMRDRCVEKVNSLADDYSGAWARQALKDAAREISSLTLDNCESEG